MPPSAIQRFRDRPRPPVPDEVPALAPHPTENALNALTHRQLRAAVYKVAREHATGRLVDIGCGRKPHRELLAPFVDEHVGVDHAESLHGVTDVDVVASAYDIPLADGSFDTALLAEVIEHLEEPKAALEEARRLLKPGGKVIVTAPFIWVLHEEPRDFYRYSPHGMRYLLMQAGFEQVEVLPVSGSWATVAIMFSYALRPYRRGPLTPVLNALARISQRVAARMDRLVFKPDASYNHVAVATNPRPGAATV